MVYVPSATYILVFFFMTQASSIDLTDSFPMLSMSAFALKLTTVKIRIIRSR
jgi:hypothetical protein